MRRRTLHLIFVSAVVLLPASVLAQSDAATISGRITDQSGDVIPGAQVTVTNEQTAVELSARSNDDGIFVVRNLHPGLHRMAVEKDGFKTIVLEHLSLAVQDVLGRNFTMELSPIKDSVTVMAGHEEQNLSPAVSTVVNRQFVENLPLNGRSFQSLIQLTPGVLVMPSGQGSEGQFNVNGQRTNSNYFSVDGVSANFATNASVDLGQNLGGTLPALTIGGGTNSFVSVDAMQEFRIQTSTYAAEFGRTPGGQFAIVTKSGANRFHGTAFDYVRNEAFDARNWFSPPPEPKPPLRQHDFGGTLGGPVSANRSFFFFSYEGLRLHQPQTATGYFYTPETRSVVAPVYQPIVNALPIPNGDLLDPACDNVTTPCLARLTDSYANPTSFDAYSLRLDHTVRQLTLFARVGHTPSTASTRRFSSLDSLSLNADMLTVGATAVLSSVLVNDLRANWSRSTGIATITLDDAHGAMPPPASSMFPPGAAPTQNQASVRLPDGSSVAMGTRAANVGRQLNVVDTFSAVAGSHYLKLGVDYRYFRPTNEAAGASIAFLTDFSQLRSGTVSQVASLAFEPITVATHNWSLFAQDTWKAAERLTLTYGMRWEINTPPASTTAEKPLYAIEGIFDSKPLQFASPGTPLWRTRYNDVAPRLGAAYQIASSTILRGGLGLFYDLGYGRPLGSLIFGFPYNRNRIVPAAGQPYDLTSPLFTPPPLSTSLRSIPQGNLAAFDPNLRLPMTWHWNATVEQELGDRQSLTVAYVGASGHRLLRPDFVVPPGSALDIPPISATRNAGNSRYAALQTQFQRRWSGGFQALASYTLATASDQGSDDGGGNSFGVSRNANFAASVGEIQLPPLSPADFDVRHAFAAAVSYELPAPKRGSAVRAMLEDWAVDAIVRASSPPPLNVRIEGVSPELGAYFTQPDLVPGQPIWRPAPDQPRGRALNPDAFTLPAVGTQGSLRRNSIRSPFTLNQTDFVVRRRFPFSGGASVEFRAEFFNLFNTPMFGGFLSPNTFWGRCASLPCTGRQSPSFGRVVQDTTLNQGLGGGGLLGGQSAIYAVGGPRSIQLSLKLRF